MESNRSNSGDRVVRTIVVYESGRVQHRAADAHVRKAGVWGRAGAHALPNDGPSDTPPAPRVKNAAKVAAGKARAAQAKAAGIKGKFVKAPPPPPAKKAPAAKKAKGPHGGARTGSGPKPKDENGAAMVVVAFRVTPEQKAKLERLGNGEFVRERIERAAEPK